MAEQRTTLEEIYNQNMKLGELSSKYDRLSDVIKEVQSLLGSVQSEIIKVKAQLTILEEHIWEDPKTSDDEASSSAQPSLERDVSLSDWIQPRRKSQPVLTHSVALPRQQFPKEQAPLHCDPAAPPRAPRGPPPSASSGPVGPIEAPMENVPPILSGEIVAEVDPKQEQTPLISDPAEPLTALIGPAGRIDTPTENVPPSLSGENVADRS